MLRDASFGSANEVVVIDDVPTSTTPHEARAFVLDAASGRVTRDRTWKVAGCPFIFATAKDGYIVVTDKGVDSYSAGLDHIMSTGCEAARDASPDGGVVAAWCSTLRPGHGLTLFLDARTLKPTGIEVRDSAVESVSRDHTAPTGLRENTTNRTVIYHPADDQLPPNDTGCSGSMPRFISSRTVAILGLGRVQAVGTHGDRLFEDKLRGEEQGVAEIPRDGSRFAGQGADAGQPEFDAPRTSHDHNRSTTGWSGRTLVRTASSGTDLSDRSLGRFARGSPSWHRGDGSRR